MSDASSRNRRNSVYNNSKNSVISTLRAKIKSATDGKYSADSFDPMIPGCIVEREQILLNKKIKNVRKVYMLDNKYKIGWIVDSDITFCMVCFGGFGWFNLKHHCRACGLLVCGGCSPFVTVIPQLEEENGSRVCKQCFGLKSVPSSPVPATPPNSHNRSASVNNSNSKYDFTDRHSVQNTSSPYDAAAFSGGNTSRRTIGGVSGVSRLSTADRDASSRSLMSDLSNVDGELSQLEKTLEPKYEEAYK